MRAVFVLLGLAALASAPASAQQTQEQGFVIRSETREVLLDLVIRDRRGRTVSDIRPDELRILEDGQPQEIVSFRLIDGSSGRIIRTNVSGEAVGAAPDVLTQARERGQDPLRLNHLVSIVFHGLQQESRKYVLDAAQEFLDKNLGDNVYVGIFAIDNQLMVVEPYTNDHDKLRAAIRRASQTATTPFSSIAGNISQTDAGTVQFETPAEAGPGARPETTPVTGQTVGLQGSADIFGEIVQRIQQQSTVNMGFFDKVDRGDRLILSLANLVAAQSILSGRKTAILFSSGFQLAQDSIWRLELLISDANEANVSFYSVDSVGLRTVSPDQARVASLRGALPPGLISRTTGALNPEVFRSYEATLDSLRANPQANLGELASETGGRLIANTNNFAKPLDRVVEDMLTYYEVSYRPPAAKHDGSFRTLSVELDRPKVEVQSRSGYFDLPPGAEYNVAPHEMPLLAAMASNPAPNEFPFRSQVLRFPEHPSLLAVEFSLADLAMSREDDRLRGQLSLLAVLKNAQGAIVQRASQTLPLDVDAGARDAFRTGQFSLQRLWDIEPGRYTLEVAVRDHQGGKLGVKRSMVVIPGRGPGPALSEVALIRDIQQAPEDPVLAAYDPLTSSIGKARPTLEDRIDRSAAGSISHYFVVYPDRESSDAPQLSVEYYREGQLAGQLKPELSEPKADGSIPFIATAPAQSFPPGHYIVEAAVQQGSLVARKSAAFEVVEP